MTVEIFDDDVSIVHGSRLVLAVSAAPVPLGLGLACSAQPLAAGLGALLAWLGAGMALHMWVRNPVADERRRRARADARGLFLDGCLVLPSGQITGGWLEPRRKQRPLVHVCAAGPVPNVRVVVRDAEQGRALLRALVVDATQVSARYWTMAFPLGEPRAFRRAIGATLAALAFGVATGHAFPAALALAVVAVLVFFAGAVVPTQLTVGADGLLVRWLATTRYVRWGAVEHIEPFDGGVALALEGGAWMTLRSFAVRGGGPCERDAMFERMHAAWRNQSQSRVDAGADRLLRRPGGKTREWVRAMRAIGSAQASYRISAVPTERLWGVAENAAADRTSRLGAALALSPTLDNAGRARLRAAASACVEPELRNALTAASTLAGANASDDELAASLDAIEAEGG